jgi:hypothetical protein
MLAAVVLSGQAVGAAIVAGLAATRRGLVRGLPILRRTVVHRRGAASHRSPPAPVSPAPPAALPEPLPQPLPSVVMVAGAIHPGAFCSLEGSWGKTADGRLLRCTGAPDGQRPRWREPA